MTEQTELGVEAWRALHAFGQAKSKATGDDTAQSLGPRPRAEEIRVSWAIARDQVAAARLKQNKTSSKAPGSQSKMINADHLGVFLSGILSHRRDPVVWDDEVLSLAMNEQPYESSADLEAYCNSFIQLMSIVPQDLIMDDASGICQNMIRAGSHNAFSIRSGGEDLEEYMGYAIYPSASYFNHSCAPNIAKRRVGRHWEFSAAREIPQGEQCCITYLGGDERTMDVEARRARLQDVWGFVCMCARCVEEQG